MKSSATVFLAAFLALSASWGGFVLAPQLQLGLAPLTKPVGADNLYPLARPGLAQQGAQVYRSLGCVHCHSQSVRQEGTICEVVFSEPGTNNAAVLAALGKVDPSLAKAETLADLPKTVGMAATVPAAEPLVKALTSAGGKAFVRVVPLGADLARGWGVRQSVAQDFVHDQPVQWGTRRLGPDLANIGARKADANWHLLHLYDPKAAVTNSTMPPYRFLFERRKIVREPSPDALPVASEPGYEIVPTDEARALAAYLVSLRSDAPLFEAPYTGAPPVAAPADTNAPAADNKSAALSTRAVELLSAAAK